jgi:ribosomal protein S18 acetylase RimI-like enzyme
VELEILEANLTDPTDAAAVIELIDAYAADPMGRGEPLSDAVRKRLATDLTGIPGVLLTRLEGQAVGVAVCFPGYSTFEARPLLNVHDIAVLPEMRRRGVGRALLSVVERKARERACCRITLEVREDKPSAQGLYRSMGYGLGIVPMAFWGKSLD